ncbi:hypothetical protein D5086_023769 [Populus alba]|uniref:Uncharacterized protein n=1 Tax=Populus alba TaxID=43335 RepID=A0ACC4BAR3_POPAL
MGGPQSIKARMWLMGHQKLMTNGLRFRSPKGFRRAILEIDSASLVSASRGRTGTATQNPVFIECLHLPKLVWEVN